MIKPKSRSLLSMCLLVGLATMWCAGCEVQQLAASDRKVERTEQSLITAGDADSLAAAAMISIGPKFNPEQRLALIARAAAKAPDRPDLVWLNVRLCTQVQGCDSEPLEAQLRVLDPDNGAAWFDAIGRAAKRNDAAAVRNALMAIAMSTRFDMYWNATIVHATNAIVRTHTMDLPTASITTFGAAAAIGIPAYQTIVTACKGDALKDPAVLDSCRRVSSVMRRGDTYLTEMIGLAIAKHAWTEGSAEYVEAVSAQRTARYQMDTDNKISLHRFSYSRYLSARLRLMTEKRTEQEVDIAEIKNARFDPNPPSDWVDRSAGS